MIFTANKTITIDRFLETTWEKEYDTVVTTWLQVYIEPFDDTIWATIDGEWAFNIQKLFTDFINVQVSDKLTDED